MSDGTIVFGMCQLVGKVNFKLVKFLKFNVVRALCNF